MWLVYITYTYHPKVTSFCRQIPPVPLSGLHSRKLTNGPLKNDGPWFLEEFPATDQEIDLV